MLEHQFCSTIEEKGEVTIWRQVTGISHHVVGFWQICLQIVTPVVVEKALSNAQGGLELELCGLLFISQLVHYVALQRPELHTSYVTMYPHYIRHYGALQRRYMLDELESKGVVL